MDLIKENINIVSIKEDAVVKIEISGQFYQRLNGFVLQYAESQGEDAMLQAMAKIQRKQAATDPFSFNLETLLLLVRTVEQEFEKEGHTVVNNVEIEVPQTVRDSYQDKLKS